MQGLSLICGCPISIRVYHIPVPRDGEDCIEQASRCVHEERLRPNHAGNPDSRSSADWRVCIYCRLWFGWLPGPRSCPRIARQMVYGLQSCDPCSNPALFHAFSACLTGITTTRHGIRGWLHSGKTRNPAPNSLKHEHLRQSDLMSSRSEPSLQKGRVRIPSGGALLGIESLIPI